MPLASLSVGRVNAAMAATRQMRSAIEKERMFSTTDRSYTYWYDMMVTMLGPVSFRAVFVKNAE